VSPERFDGKHEYEPCTCLWDTGASYCGISGELADKWKLPVIGRSEEELSNGEVVRNPVYAISLRFDDGSEHELIATRISMKGVDVLIGLTMISEGHFRIDPLNEVGLEFTFTL
jgi:predicted aspartyl protease